jgi:hypothetical protein
MDGCTSGTWFAGLVTCVESPIRRRIRPSKLLHVQACPNMIRKCGENRAVSVFLQQQFGGAQKFFQARSSTAARKVLGLLRPF